MASQSEQRIRSSAVKPLNPNAKEFYGATPVKTWHPLSGGPGFYQIPLSPTLFSPIYAYHPHCFGFLSVTKRHMEVAALVPEWRTGEEMDMCERMIGNTQRSRCMSQKRNRSTREYGKRWKVLRDGHPVIPFPPSVEECHRSRTTTVMIKNIPYHFQLLLFLTLSLSPYLLFMRYND